MSKSEWWLALALTVAVVPINLGFAATVTPAWAAWGVMLGAIFASNRYVARRLILVAALAASVPVAVAVFRVVPVHALTPRVTRLEITFNGANWVEVTHPADIAEFESYVSRGSLKVSYYPLRRYRLRIRHGSSWDQYSNWGGELARDQDGICRTVFSPSRRGFNEWLERVVRKYDVGPRPVSPSAE